MEEKIKIESIVLNDKRKKIMKELEEKTIEEMCSYNPENKENMLLVMKQN